MEWPKWCWTILLQTILSGKAQKTYSALSAEDSADYMIKAAILKNYELVPEAYRQRFRSHKRGEGQSYPEFIRDKEGQFDKWCSSKNVGKKYGKLKQLILME